MSKRKLDTTVDELQQKKLKPDDHATSVPPVEGFQLSRTRLMTGSGNFHRLTGDCVVLWMSRDQRVNDNHAFNYAQSIALEMKIPLRVVFNLVPKFLQATLRQYSFMLDGLKEVERQCNELNIPFHLLFGLPVENIPKFVLDKNAAALVTDFSPLRVSREWVSAVASEIKTQAPTTPFVQVDAHNIIPCWVASPKLEYSARTFRSKVHGKIAEYLNEIPPPVQHPYGSLDTEPVNWNTVLDSLEINRDVEPVNWIVSGPSAADQMLQDFITQRLALYAENRNDPNKIAISNLSPYIHFGQISVQSMVLKLKKLKKYATSVDGFIEEAVVRRELTDNFCYYNENYDNINGAYDWAKETLNVHRSDKRQFLYCREQLERAETHDDLWNAAQIQMTKEGKMHGFLRMYWAKKILEWTESPELALDIAIFLNDKYQLDGRDPNGYVGCMWSICGIHDQGWGERAIFGKIRYMNYEGCKRKFDVAAFVRKYPPAAQNAAKAKGFKTLLK